jgi:hypothetical protein
MTRDFRGTLLQRPTLLSLGVTDPVIATQLRTGDLERLRRGRYAAGGELPSLDARDRHALEVRAALSRVKTGARAAKESAVVLLGGEVFGRCRVVQLVRASGSAARYPHLVVDRVDLPREHCATVQDLPVTAGARSAIDLARTRPLPQALVAADSLLRVGACDEGELRSVLSYCRLWPGARAAAMAVDHANPLAETAFESYSRGLMILHGIELPEIQVWLLGADGRWYRVDFYWRRQRLIGEADGRIKYKVGTDLLEEKHRQETLSQRGHNFIRWDWPEAVYDDAALARRWRRRLTELS